MVVLFLYHRLHSIATRQLDCIRQEDFNELERLTRERESVTRELSDTIDEFGGRAGGIRLSEAVRRKVNEMAAATLRVDAEIKDLLVEELRVRGRGASDEIPIPTD